MLVCLCNRSLPVIKNGRFVKMLTSVYKQDVSRCVTLWHFVTVLRDAWKPQETAWYPVYTIQPVVKPVVQPAVSCKQTYNRLSNRFDNRLDVCLHDTATVRSSVLNEQPLFVQPVVKLVWQPVWQQAVSCKRGLRDHRRPQETLQVTPSRALSRGHRQKELWLAAAALPPDKCNLPMSANSTDIQFNITLLRFYIMLRYKPVRNTPNTNCSVPQSAFNFLTRNFQ